MKKDADLRTLRNAAFMLILLAFAAPAGAGPTTLQWAFDGDIAELSGCARFLQNPQQLWIHNDSGNAARLYAVDLQGRVRQRVDIRDAKARDWEDIASFRWHGMPYLAIADTGDNFSWHAEAAVLLLPEPQAGIASVAPQRTIRFHYPDGAHDVEALAIDVVAGDILLLEKRRPPARLYRLALSGPDQQVAQAIATLPDWWPEPATPAETIGAWHYRGAVTAMDLSDDGLRLAMLTSTHWMVFTRRAGENWQSAFSRQPHTARIPRRGTPRNTVFEALCWAADGGLWISGERLPAPLLHVAPDAVR